MTKLIFDLERFKEFLREIDSTDKYTVDLSESPTVIVCRSNYFISRIDGSRQGGTTVTLVGRIKNE